MPQFITKFTDLVRQNNSKKMTLFMFCLFAILYTADRLTKLAVCNSNIISGSPFEVTSFFNMVFVLNDGVSFGLMSGLGARWFLLILAFFISIIVFVFAAISATFYEKFAFTAILAGAMGNITDRASIGGVVDFLDFYIGSHHWPAFNVADACICVGTAILILLEVRKAFAKQNR